MNMKNLIFVVLLCLFSVTGVNAQAPTKKEIRKEYREITSYLKDNMDKDVPYEDVMQIIGRAKTVTENMDLVYGTNKKCQEKFDIALLTGNFVMAGLMRTLKEI